MRLLICGDRDFRCVSTIACGIESFGEPRHIVIVDPASAPVLALSFAKSIGIPIEEYNEMDPPGSPDRCLAFGAIWKRVALFGWAMTYAGKIVNYATDFGVPVRWVLGEPYPMRDITEMPKPPR